MANLKHTATPWRKDMGALLDREPYLRSIVGPDGRTICLKGFAISGGNFGTEEAEANSDLVLRAVNCHADLVAALKEARGVLADYITAAGGQDDADRLMFERFDAALARAEASS